MEHAQLAQQLTSKYKHLRSKDAESINALAQQSNERGIVRALAAKVYNPTIIALLYWLLPLFWLFNRSFTEQRISGVLQFALALAIFPGLHFYQQLGWMARSINDDTPIEQVFFQMGWYTALAILTLWFFIDGFTISTRVRKGNYKRLQKALK